MREQFNEIIAARIKELRKNQKPKMVSREELEEKCGLPNQSIKRIETKQMSKVDVNDLCAIADFFDVDVEYLLGKQDEKRRVIADASQITGLSYEAVNLLVAMKGHQFPVSDILSKMICNPNFYSLMERITALIDLTPEAASYEVINSEVNRLKAKFEGKKPSSPRYNKRDDVYDTQENLVMKSFNEIIRAFENK